MSNIFSGVITAVAGIAAFKVRGQSSARISLALSGTSAATYQFETSLDSTNGTDGNWAAVQVARSGTNQAETNTGSLSATPAYNWAVNLTGVVWFRIRCSAATTAGTATVTVSASQMPMDPAPSVQVNTHAVTQSGAWTVTPLTPTPANIASAASTNATSTKTSAGTLYQVSLFNAGAAAAYVKFYNKASAPTVGTDIPVLVIAIPATSTVTPQLGALGHRFSVGIAYAITAGAAYTDTAAVAANQVLGCFDYV